ncbi:MAG: hypothetical protein KGL63_09720 [Betaproteobacteria bacterium]|uniref:DotH/IcmK family type IV secretion protein n=1 Tax=Acidiphilium sp. C61 TaxID=1671485 RepID=UPI00157B511B|nr:DotH/IcmK family type IV secretion protein [Acidiphilium sp. C61]MDE2343647.1 hypothetical protein [Betaproteobacteria bacterium]
MSRRLIILAVAPAIVLSMAQIAVGAQLPAQPVALGPTGAPVASPDFYAPPQAADPIAPPAMLVQDPSEQPQTSNGRPAPPLPPGVTGANFAAAAAAAAPTLMPPSEITHYKQMLDAVARAKAATVGPPPKAGNRSIMMSLVPGAPAPMIHLYPGNATAITFADETGAPWPVTSAYVDKSKYTIDNDISGKGASTNIVVISANQAHAEANNLVVTLKGLPVPLTFNLTTGGRKVDFGVNVTVARLGPNAQAAAVPVSSLAPTNDAVLQSFVDGVPPGNAQALTTSSPAVQAWSLNGTYYVRTRMTLIGTNTDNSSDQNTTTHIQNSVYGVHVYEIAPTPAVLASSDGHTSIVTLEPKQ